MPEVVPNRMTNSSNIDNLRQMKDNQTDMKIEMPKNMSNTSSSSGLEMNSSKENNTKMGRRLLEDGASRGSGDSSSQSDAKTNQEVHAATVENDGGLEEEADSTFDLFRDNDEIDDEYNYDYDDYTDESMWGDEEWTEALHETAEDFVHIDAHVLCTPVSLISPRFFFRVSWQFQL